MLLWKCKETVHQLYNSISENSGVELDEIKEVLLKTYVKLDKTKDCTALINRLVNFIYFKGYPGNLKFTDSQIALINELTQIGKKAGINGIYRGDYTDKSQFD